MKNYPRNCLLHIASSYQVPGKRDRPADKNQIVLKMKLLKINVHIWFSDSLFREYIWHFTSYVKTSFYVHQMQC